MKLSKIIKIASIGVAAILLTACSSSRHHGASVTDANGMGGAGGANVQGLGTASNGGFQPNASCNVPQTSGFNTQAFYFDYNSNSVHSEDMSRIQTLAQNAAANHVNVRVVGNTDDRGSREYNVALGWRRANALATTLEQNGINKQQVTADSNGAEKPIAYGTSEEDYQCNRRVDVVYK